MINDELVCLGAEFENAIEKIVMAGYVVIGLKDY